MEKIAVIGAGLMGHGIAQVFAVAGHSVSIYDSVADVLGRVPARMRDNLQALGLDVSAVERIALQSTLPAAAACGSAQRVRQNLTEYLNKAAYLNKATGRN